MYLLQSALYSWHSSNGTFSWTKQFIVVLSMLRRGACRNRNRIFCRAWAVEGSSICPMVSAGSQLKVIQDLEVPCYPCHKHGSYSFTIGHLIWTFSLLLTVRYMQGGSEGSRSLFLLWSILPHTTRVLSRKAGECFCFFAWNVSVHICSWALTFPFFSSMIKNAALIPWGML